MVILATFFNAVATILHSIIFLYTWIVIISALITWVNPDPYNPLVRILYSLTEPVYKYIRYYLPVNFNGIDFAPIVLLLSLQFIDLFFVEVLKYLAQSI